MSTEKSKEQESSEGAAVSHKVFRNNQARIFYLKRRPHQPQAEPNYLLHPGATVQAHDEQEEKLLTDMGLVDVAKETPQLGNQVDDLRKQLDEQKTENERLRKERDDLAEKGVVTAPEATGEEAGEEVAGEEVAAESNPTRGARRRGKK